MAGRVRNREEIYLAGHRYPISGSVTSFLASQRPPKFITGDVVEESNPIVSSITWDDWRRGIGRELFRGPDDLGKSWTSELNQRFTGHLTLNNIHPANNPFDTGGDSILSVTHLAEFSGTALQIGTSTGGLHTIAEIGGASASQFRTLASSATDVAVGVLNGAYTLAIAQGSDVDWSTDTALTSWSRNAENITLLEFHNNVLFGMDNSGRLFFTPDLSSSWTELTRLNAQAGSAKAMREGPDGNGGRVLYIASDRGLHVYDRETERILDTPLNLSRHPKAGIGLEEWRGSMYYSAGLSLYRYTPLGGQQLIETVGLDRDGGIPPEDAGYIDGLAGSNNYLFATVRNDSYFGTLYRFADDAWDKEHEISTRLMRGNPLVATPDGGVYRLYSISTDSNNHSRIFANDLPPNIINPAQRATGDFDGFGNIEMPWVISPADQDWTALSVLIDSNHPTSSETVAVKYATDFSSAFTTLDTKDSTGVTRYNLTDSEGQVGVSFSAFRLRLDFVRGATLSNSPDVRKLSLIYRKNFTPLLGFQFNIDLNKPGEGRSAKERLTHLREFFKDKNPQEFTFRDDDDAETTYYVTPVSLGGLEKTGQIEDGIVQLTVVQTIPNTSG